MIIDIFNLLVYFVYSNGGSSDHYPPYVQLVDYLSNGHISVYHDCVGLKVSA